MLTVLAAVLSFAAAEAQPITVIDDGRTDPASRSRATPVDRATQVTEGERAGDGANPDRLICDWRRIPGSNRRERVCSTVADRRAARDIARETVQQMQGSVTDPVG